jgi:hypothetical protein
VINFYVPSPILQAIATLDATGNDIQKAIELAMIQVDHKAKTDAEFNFRVAVVALLEVHTERALEDVYDA